MVSTKSDIKRLLKSCWRLILVLFCFAAPFAAKADRFLDYETGEFFEGILYDKTLWPTETFDVGTQSIEIEIDIKCAMVEPSYGYEGCVRWLIPNTGWINEVGKPEVLERSYSYNVEEGYKSGTLTILEAEYKDFNYILQRALPMDIYQDDYIDPNEIPDITPYEEFYPDQPASISYWSNRGDNKIYMTVYPIAYDYEHQIVRAYTHLKIRVDHLKDEAGIEEVGAYDAPTEYFNLQGIKVDKPEHGVYIERKGGNAAKVVF